MAGIFDLLTGQQQRGMLNGLLSPAQQQEQDGAGILGLGSALLAASADRRPNPLGRGLAGGVQGMQQARDAYLDRAYKQLALQQQLARDQSGSALPAAIQIANEYAKARDAGDTQRMNDLALAAKSFDRGVQMDANGNAVTMTGYPTAVSTIEGAKAGAKQQAEKAVDLVMDPQIKSVTRTAENDADLLKEQNKKAVQAQDTLDTLDLIEAPDETGRSLLDKATGSALGAGVAAGKQFLGQSDESTQANAQLAIYGNTLINNVPRMEGPQSDSDRKFYIEQAGKIADPKVPAPDKKAAMAAIRKLRTKYTGGPVTPTDPDQQVLEVFDPPATAPARPPAVDYKSRYGLR